MFPARDGGGGDRGRDAYWYTQRLQTLAHARQWTRATELLRTMHAERVPDAQAAYRVSLAAACLQLGASADAFFTPDLAPDARAAYRARFRAAFADALDVD